MLYENVEAQTVFEGAHNRIETETNLPRQTSREKICAQLRGIFHTTIGNLLHLLEQSQAKLN